MHIYNLKGDEVMRKEKVVFVEGRRDGYGVDQIINNSMTVRELIDYLTLNFDEDSVVMLSNDNGYTYGTITEDSVYEADIKIAEDEDED